MTSFRYRSFMELRKCEHREFITFVGYALTNKTYTLTKIYKSLPDHGNFVEKEKLCPWFEFVADRSFLDSNNEVPCMFQEEARN